MNYKIKSLTDLPDKFKIDVRGEASTKESVSEQVQRRLFELDCKWEFGGSYFNNSPMEYLLVKSGSMNYGQIKNSEIGKRRLIPWVTVEELFETEGAEVSSKIAPKQIPKAAKGTPENILEGTDVKIEWGYDPAVSSGDEGGVAKRLLGLHDLDLGSNMKRAWDSHKAEEVRRTLLEQSKAKRDTEVLEAMRSMHTSSVGLSQHLLGSRPNAILRNSEGNFVGWGDTMFPLREDMYTKDDFVDSQGITWDSIIKITETLTKTKQEKQEMTFNFDKKAVEERTFVFGVDVTDKPLTEAQYLVAIEALKDKIKENQDSIKQYKDLNLGEVSIFEDTNTKLINQFKEITALYTASTKKDESKEA